MLACAYANAYAFKLHSNAVVRLAIQRDAVELYFTKKHMLIA
jgi:hypothetical protein